MRLIPSVEKLGDVKSNAERRVANLLSQANLGADAVAYHSVHLPEHEYKRMSEVDFVVVLKDCVVVVEVKGGRIAREAGSWRFTNRYDQVSLKREGPFEQAQSGMFALERRLRDQLPGLIAGFAFLVVTPDQQLPGDPEWNPWEHMGLASMSVAGLEKALASARSHLKSLPRSGSGNAPQQVAKILRADFDRVPKLNLEAQSIELEYVELLEDQYAVLLSAEDNKRVLCKGGAGTGKTLLAAETARRAARAGKSVIFSCRSGSLLAHVKSILTDTGVLCVAFDDLPNHEPVEVLVLDEAQDVMNLDDMAIAESSLIGGMQTGVWRLFCDTNNQAHVGGKFEQEMLDLLSAHATTVRLHQNCRNTASVVRQTQLLLGADLGVPRIGAGPRVETKKYDLHDEQAALLDQRLKELTDEGISLDEIAIVTLKGDTSHSSATMTSNFRRGRARYAHSAAGSGFARIYSPSEIKGLEAAHVCVVDIEDLTAENATYLLYVAMTRPRISLWMALSVQAWQQVGDRPIPDLGAPDES